MKIGGQERPISLGLNQTIEYCEQNDCSVTKYNQDIQRMAKGEGSGREIRDLIWSALKAGAISKGLTNDFTVYDVGNWLEELTPEDMATFMQEVADSMPKAKENKEVKKKIASNTLQQ